MLAVFYNARKTRNVLVDPNKYEYSLQSMSCQGTKLNHSGTEGVATSSIIISLSNNHNNNINQAIAKCAASAIEIQHISNAVANPDIPGRSVLVNLVSEMNRSPSLVAAERPKVP